MGLDTTHDCWHGAYSYFSEWRKRLCEVAGYGNIKLREGFGGDLPWPDNDPLVDLLNHSDCDGELLWMRCAAIADRIESLMPAMRIADYAQVTQQFIDGLRLAAAKQENVLFH